MITVSAGASTICITLPPEAACIIQALGFCRDTNNKLLIELAIRNSQSPHEAFRTFLPVQALDTPTHPHNPTKPDDDDHTEFTFINPNNN